MANEFIIRKGYKSLSSSEITGSLNVSADTYTTDVFIDGHGSVSASLSSIVANDLDGSGTANYISKFSDTDTLADSIIYDSGTNIGIGTTSPGHKLEVNGDTKTNSLFVNTSTSIAGSIITVANTNSSTGLSANSFHDITRANTAATSNAYTYGTVNRIDVDSNFAEGGIITQNSIARSNGAGDIGSLYTVMNQATVQGTGTVNYAIAGHNVSKLNNASGTVNSLWGTHTGVTLTAGTAGSISLLNFNFDQSAGTTVTGDFQYINISNDTVLNISGTARALNIESNLPSFFSGSIGIGTSSPLHPLHVVGNISGSDTYINGWNSVSGSLSTITTTHTNFSASVSTRFEGLTTDYTELDNIPDNIISSSAQVDHDQTTNFVAGEHFLQSAITTVGTVTTGNVNAILPTNTVSSSAQIASDISGSITSFSGSIAGRVETNESSIASLNGATGSYLLNTTDTLTGNLTVTGTLTAQEFHTEFVSASILFDSGSTKFGDSSDDKHSFTGSLEVSGSGITIKVPTTPKIELIDQTNDLSLKFRAANNYGYIDLDSGNTVGSSRLLLRTDGYPFLYGNQNHDVYIPSGSLTIGTESTTGNFNSYISATRQLTHNGNGGDLSIISDNNSAPVFFVKGTGTADLVNIYDNTTEVFTILDGGNVGIGITSPTNKLDIEGVFGVKRVGVAATSTIDMGGNFNFDAFSGYSHVFKQSGIERVRILPNGNLGIGTTNPVYKLHIAGNVNIAGTGGYLRWNSGDVAIKNEGSYKLGFQTYNATSSTLTTKMVLDTDGNVGIGTTSPGAKLDISDTGTVMSRIISSDGNTARLDLQSSGNSRYSISALNTDTLLFFDESNGQISARYNGGASGYWTLNTAGTERLRINSSGNVGIGTTSPIGSLNVSKDSTTDGLSQAITISSSTTSTKRMNLGYVPGSNYSFIDTINYGVNNTNQALSLQPNGGDVGIGTTSPGAKLDVDGDVLIKSGEYISWGTVGATSIEGSTVSNKLQFRTNSADRMIINSSGNVGIGTNNPGSKLEVKTSGFNSTIELDNSDSQYSIIQHNAEGATKGLSGYNSGFMLFGGESGVTTRLQSGGAYAATILTNGNVGIGTTNPGAKLHVIDGSCDIITEATTAGNSARLRLKTTYGEYRVGSHNNSYWVYDSVAGSYRMWINSSGNVGIGTTSPSYRLTAYGSSADSEIVASFGSANDQNEYTAIGLSGFIASNGATKAGLALKRTSLYGTGELHFLNNNTTDNSDMTLSDSKMVILGNGNVGIGTTNPGSKLEVSGDIDSDDITINGWGSVSSSLASIATAGGVNGSGTTNDVVMWSGANSISDAPIAISGNNATFAGQINASTKIGLPDGGDLFWDGGYSSSKPVLAANGTTMKMYPSGVTSGVQFALSPTAATFTGTININSNKTLNLKNVDNTNGFQIFNSGATGTYNANLVFLSGAVGERMRITSSGNVGIGTTSPGSKLTVAGSGGSTKGTNGYLVHIGGTDSSVDPVRYMIGFSHGNIHTPGNVRAAIGSIVTTGGGGNLVFETGTNGTGQTERMRIDSTGIIHFSKTNNTSHIVATINHASNNFLYVSGGTGGASFGDDGQSTRMLAFDNDYLRFDTAASERMRITSSGNVGIGTTNPIATYDKTLHIEGTNPIIRIETDNDSGWAYNQYVSPQGSWSVGIDEAEQYVIAKHTTLGSSHKKFLINTNGNVGIGTTSVTAADGLLKISAPSGNGQSSSISLYGNNGNLYGGSNVVRSRITSLTDGTAFGAELTFSTNDTSNVVQERMRITAGGNVGIGTDSPDSKLDVRGASATPADGNQTLSITNTTGGTQLNIGTAENSYGWIEAREGATLRNLLLNPNGGNIGIGTTSPGTKLNLVEPTSANPPLSIQNSNADGYSGAWFYDSSGTIVGHLGWANGTTTNLSDKMYFGSIASKDIVFTTSDTEKMRIDSDGNVGIGKNTSLGVHKLSILKGASNQQLGLYYDENNVAMFGARSNGDAQIYAWNGSSYRNILLGVDATNTNAGNVGIGTTVPSNKLDVRGSNTVAKFVSSTGYVDQVMVNSGATNFLNFTGSTFNLYNNGGSAGNITLSITPTTATFTGNVTVEGALTETSARRFKENIKTLDNQISNISKLNPVSFDWKKDSKSDIGFIAEEVKEVYPNLVSEEDGEIKGVQYTKLTAILVKALQDQQKQIDELKEEIFILKKK